MSHTPQQIFQDCSHDFIGLPYDSFDCYDIVKLFYIKVFQVSLDPYIYSEPLNHKKMSNLINEHRSKYEKVFIPKFGDIILLKVYGVPSHLGIFLGENRFLHTTKPTGCIIDDLRFWSKKVEGYYSYDKN